MAQSVQQLGCGLLKLSQEYFFCSELKVTDFMIHVRNFSAKR
jgi:hypothetical protein